MSRLVTVILLLCTVAALLSPTAFADTEEPTVDPVTARFSYLSFFTVDELVSYLNRYNISANSKVSRQQLLMAAVGTIVKQADAIDGGAPIPADEAEPETIDFKKRRKFKNEKKKAQELKLPEAEEGAVVTPSHTLDARYCVTLGYKESYQLMEKVLQHRLPNLIEYNHGYMEPPAFQTKALVYLLRYGWVYAALLVATAKFWKSPKPSKAQQILSSHWKKTLVFGLALSLISYHMQVTGGFEVFLDGKKMYSLLETNSEVPDIHVVMELIVRQLQRSIQEAASAAAQQ